MYAEIIIKIDFHINVQLDVCICITHYTSIHIGANALLTVATMYQQVFSTIFYMYKGGT